MFGGGESSNAPPPDTRWGRRRLRHELFQRLGPLQAINAFAFVQINRLPHTRLSDGFLTRLSWVMTSGAGWLLFLLLATLVDRQRGWKAMRACGACPLVSYRDRRASNQKMVPPPPTLSLIDRGNHRRRKPGSYSFPSGHSAAAFAGALLLAREYSGTARGFFGLASHVAFARIYLGVHCPGDVLSGSLLGMVLARIYSRFLRKIGIAAE